MKKLIIVTAIMAAFSAMATAGGLADRINEERSYPNKTEHTKSMHMHCMHEKQNHGMVKKSQANQDESREVNYGKEQSERAPINHNHH
ncbi:hypothetical protein [Marinobacter alkaliphilus]|uniref:Uncharacterized protein n=1 Tax=Marinobacter alkaliphilus TaxID=254719 RepID=A0ABZ3E178_9GAMM